MDFRAIPLTEQFHHRADGGDAFALGDDEGDQRLPGILPQNANACAGLGSQLQKGILRRNGPADVPIVPVQIEIRAPDVFPGILVAAHLVGNL